MPKGKRSKSRRARPAYDEAGHVDSQCWFPPVELVALVAAGVLDPSNKLHTPVLDVGCGAGTEALYLANMGWNRVFGIDSDDDALKDARRRAQRRGIRFAKADFQDRWSDLLPTEWPKRFGVVLDRLFTNNFGPGDDDPEAWAMYQEAYFARMSELVRPGGMLVVRDRLSADLHDATFRRLLFSAVSDKETFGESGGERYFELCGPATYVRLVGDDTPDRHRLDALIPIKGRLAVLRRKKG